MKKQLTYGFLGGLMTIASLFSAPLNADTASALLATGTQLLFTLTS